MAEEVALDKLTILGTEVERHAHIAGGDKELAAAIAKLRRGGDVATELYVIQRLRDMGYKLSEIAAELGMRFTYHLVSPKPACNAGISLNDAGLCRESPNSG